MMNVETREALPEAVAKGTATIEIRLSRPQQLFNSLDPSPFLSGISTRTRKTTWWTRPTSIR